MIYGSIIISEPGFNIRGEQNENMAFVKLNLPLDQDTVF